MVIISHMNFFIKIIYFFKINILSTKPVLFFLIFHILHKCIRSGLKIENQNLFKHAHSQSPTTTIDLLQLKFLIFKVFRYLYRATVGTLCDRRATNYCTDIYGCQQHLHSLAMEYKNYSMALFVLAKKIPFFFITLGPCNYIYQAFVARRYMLNVKFYMFERF